MATMFQSMQAPVRRVRVKVCGITRPCDARLAGELGADAIGMIFYPPSPRGVNLEQAQSIMAEVAPMLTTVGVFVEPEPGTLESILHALPLDLVQLHGNESPQFCESVGRPYIKAISMREGVDLQDQAARYPGARALLLETHNDKLIGGTGQVFDWQMAKAKIPTPVILAGGLNPSNVAQAIQTVHPACVDANSGVESEPGIKDAAKLAAFIREVQRVQADKY